MESPNTKFTTDASSDNVSKAVTEVGQEKNAHEDEDLDGHYLFCIGELLHSRYEVIGQLGEGVSSKVLKCLDMGFFRLVAIKVRKGYKQGMNEYRHLNYLQQHDKTGMYCVQMLSAFDHCNHLCLVFENLGPSLDYLLENNEVKGLSCVVIREISRQLLKCVEFIHDTKHLIHTDLKPQNILFVNRFYAEIFIRKDPDGLKDLAKSNAIKLIDFGGSVISEVDDHKPFDHLIGSYPYSAPEVLLGLEWSFPCDIWSVGCILLEMLFSEMVFESQNLIEQLAIMEKLLGKIPEHILDQYNNANENSEKHLKWDLAHWQEISPRIDVETVERIPVLNDLLMKYAHDHMRSSFFKLLQGLLKYEPSDRLTAREALSHPFFNP